MAYLTDIYSEYVVFTAELGVKCRHDIIDNQLEKEDLADR